MTESATRKPWLTRRRVIVGATVLVLVLAVGVILFGTLEAKPQLGLKIAFERFDRTGDGKAFAAMFSFYNSTPDRLGVFECYSDELPSPLVAFSGPTNLYHMLLTVRNTGAEVWNPPVQFLQNVVLFPKLRFAGAARLPDDGRVGRLVVNYQISIRESRLRKMIQKFLKQSPPPRFERRTFTFDQEIQCPYVQPDGTVEPPRLLPKESKSP